MVAPAAAGTPEHSAESAGLRYVHDGDPGIHRLRAGRGFFYRDTRGDNVTDERTLKRIKTLAIPPAWTDVWIATDPRGHLQATGRDARGRKQYRYHTDWAKVRSETKYDQLAAFGRALPAIRKAVDRDLRKHTLCRDRVTAMVVRLLESSLIRVGNEAYARDNGSYGLTTMRNEHAVAGPTRVRFKFTGKSRKEHVVDVADRRVTALVRRCQELPGELLFHWEDEEGELHPVSSDDVNEYLRRATGEHFTAKHFRTWAGTLAAAKHLWSADAGAEAVTPDRLVLSAVDAAAAQLGNTRAVCRSAYVHPAVVAAEAPAARPRSRRRGLAPDEASLLSVLESGSA